jgi:hypothetical protein
MMQRTRTTIEHRLNRLDRRLKRKLARGKGLSTAARYLGVSTARLREQLRSGNTLAHIASATSGKSEAGLIEALIAPHAHGT